MESHEPPRHTFEIFLFRFPVPTQMIIYDNGCKLHQYVLNHKPVHFKNTIFLVDRFHWQDTWDVPVATPSIVMYNLTLPPYTHKSTNAVLQRIKGHIAYMKPDNILFHVKLFLELQNKDKESKLDRFR